MAARRLVQCLLSLTAVAALAAPSLAEPASPRAWETRKVWVNPVKDLAPDAVAASNISPIIYVNRCTGGCTITPGNNDARVQTSSIIGSTATISEFDVAGGDQAKNDQVFNDTIACLKDVYGPYNVQIVTDDPGDMLHHEIIMAGRPEEIGQDQNVAGIAPASCQPLNNVISFALANAVGPDVEMLCWTAAQESAHSFGLPNHEFNCTDPMTYLETDSNGQACGRKYFRNKAFGCGEFQPRDCTCVGTTQNSHQELLAVFGAGAAPATPSVNVAYPAMDSQVQDGFSVFFSATNDRGIDHADIYFNGTKYVTVPGKDYAHRDDPFSADAPSLPDGYIDVEVHAFDDLGTEGVGSTTVLKGSPCSSDDQCFDFQSCNDGRCAYPAPSGEIGDSCDYDQFCLGGICAGSDGDKVCSKSCNPTVSDNCPMGLECSSDGFCLKPSSGGCCAVAGGQKRGEGMPLVELGLFGAALVLLRRSRRRRRG